MAEQMTSPVPALVQVVSTRHAEPDWLRQVRSSAWEKYAELPSPRLDKTDLTRRAWDIGTLPSGAVGVASEEARKMVEQAQDEPLVHVIDGVVAAVQLPAGLKQQGVVFTDLHTAVTAHRDLVQRHLGTVVTADETKWAALNAALWHGGAFLYIPRHVSVETPFLYLCEDTVGVGTAFPRLLVVAEEGSVCTIQQVQISSVEGTPGSVHSGVIEVVAKPTAHVTAISLQQLRKGPTHFLTHRARVDKDASVDWIFGDIGDGFTVAVVESRCEGSGSHATTRALGLGYGRQHLDLTASMVHAGHHSDSDIVLHGVLKDRANSIYRSSTHILRGAVGAGSEQHDRMLMMDGTARADAIPMLLIDENDVQRCGHAASVGKIDEIQVYYLMSRGISKAEAMRMIIWGHLRPTVEAIPSEAPRKFVANLIERMLAP